LREDHGFERKYAGKVSSEQRDLLREISHDMLDRMLAPVALVRPPPDSIDDGCRVPKRKPNRRFIHHCLFAILRGLYP
jgi:hypothetical protein